MNKLDIADRFAEMWKTARNDAGKSQEWVAKALGVSKKTVQNWENGFSSPSQMKGFEFFSVLGLQPLPYYLRLLYPGKNTGDDEDLINYLIGFVNSCTTEQKKKLLYWSFGEHGSSPFGVLEMITAHLQTPLRDRVSIAQTILNNYEFAEKEGTTVNKSAEVKPDIEILKTAIAKGKEAVLEGNSTYTLIVDGKDVAL